MISSPVINKKATWRYRKELAESMLCELESREDFKILKFPISRIDRNAMVDLFAVRLPVDKPSYSIDISQRSIGGKPTVVVKLTHLQDSSKDPLVLHLQRI